VAATSNAMPRPSPFVTVMAQISIVLGIAGTAYALLQAVAITSFSGSESLKGAFAEISTGTLPPFADWLIGHLPAMGWSFMLISAAFLIASVGLLKRREWGRWAFIAFMVAGAAANFLGVWLLVVVFDCCNRYRSPRKPRPCRRSWRSCARHRW
jgi:hypothetical protein